FTPFNPGYVLARQECNPVVPDTTMLYRRHPPLGLAPIEGNRPMRSILVTIVVIGLIAVALSPVSAMSVGAGGLSIIPSNMTYVACTTRGSDGGIPPSKKACRRWCDKNSRSLQGCYTWCDRTCT